MFRNSNSVRSLSLSPLSLQFDRKKIVAYGSVLLNTRRRKHGVLRSVVALYYQELIFRFQYFAAYGAVGSYLVDEPFRSFQHDFVTDFAGYIEHVRFPVTLCGQHDTLRVHEQVRFSKTSSHNESQHIPMIY